MAKNQNKIIRYLNFAIGAVLLVISIKLSNYLSPFVLSFSQKEVFV